jgi:hypothetical protein
MPGEGAPENKPGAVKGTRAVWPGDAAVKRRTRPFYITKDKCVPLILLTSTPPFWFPRAQGHRLRRPSLDTVSDSAAMPRRSTIFVLDPPKPIPIG